MKSIVLLVVTAALLALPASASAEWHYTKRGAESLVRDYAYKHYEDINRFEMGAFCRPQGERYDPRFKYHRWVCGWAEDGYCGVVLIIGSRNRGAYYAKVLRGEQEC